MSKLARKQQRQQTKRRWKELERFTKEPGFSGFCEEARGEYEIDATTCCAECHADMDVLSRAEDGEHHFVVCCAVRHALCPSDTEKRLHPETPRVVEDPVVEVCRWYEGPNEEPPDFTPEPEAS